MPVFPDLASKGFEKIEFLGHIGGGFSIVKEYWQTQKRCCEEDILWFYSRYQRRRIAHTILLNVRPADETCANFRIVLQATNPDEFGISETARHKMTERQFLGMFAYFIRKRSEKDLLPIRFRFIRLVKVDVPVFLESDDDLFSLSGLKLKGSKKSPIQNITLEAQDERTILIEVSSKPVYSISQDYLTSAFFNKPIEDMIRVSTNIVEKTKEEGYARRFT